MTDICTPFDVRGYPTLVFLDVDNGLKLTYKHHRTLDEFVAFAQLLSRPVLSELESIDAYKSTVATRDVFAVLVLADPALRPQASGLIMMKMRS